MVNSPALHCHATAIGQKIVPWTSNSSLIDLSTRGMPLMLMRLLVALLRCLLGPSTRETLPEGTTLLILRRSTNQILLAPILNLNLHL